MLPQDKELNNFVQQDVNTKETDEIVRLIASQIVEFYLEYCNRNKVVPIENLTKENIAPEVVRDDPRYRKALICILFLDILKSNPERLVYATVFQGLYIQLKSNGFDHYSSLDKALSLFDVDFDEALAGKLIMNDSVSEEEFQSPIQ